MNNYKRTYTKAIEIRFKNHQFETKNCFFFVALCDGVICSFGARCAAGECVCPTDCTDAPREPVCGSTMQTYPSECELQRTACRLPPPTTLHVIFYGDCKDRLAVVPPIAMSMFSLHI